MKEILPNYQWNPPSKIRERDDQTLKTSCCEITLYTLRRVSVAIVTHINLSSPIVSLLEKIDCAPTDFFVRNSMFDNFYLFEAFFYIMRIVGSVEPRSESSFLFLYIILS